MHIIYLGSLGSRCLVSYWDYIEECGKLGCNQAYWMVPGTVTP